MPNNNNRINFQVGYNVDQASVNAVKKSLQDLQNIKFKDFKGPELDLRQIQKRAKLVLSALQKAFNVNLNTVNVDKFYSELGLVDRNLNTIYNDFAKAGNQGRAAFNGVASALVTTNTQLRLSSSLLLSMGTTMMNTVKWGVASSVMNTFTNSVREAFQYVKSLDSALTDIRIVTGDSRLLMANFAALANRAAQSLGRSTMDYTKAALTFYQQGLSEADVQARTESVLKAQNITGAGLEMADYLTAVWNGYKVANEEAELYVDKLAAVADSSASNMSLLAIAMSKVASSANLLGVPVDSLNAQIATIVATTRQAPLSVGNALKTIYSRINDIATGADDALISLGNYSEKMALVGISVLDANGRLRDTGDVIDEIGGKWETLSHEQQIYLARTMAGQRQYNNLLALFENWGKYTDLVNVSLNSQGTTMEKNSRYMLSLEAHLEQLGSASLRLKSSMIDSDSFKGFIDFGTKGVLLLANLIESIGGGGNALLGLGSIATQVFSGIISKLISNVIIKAQQNKQIYEDMRAKMALVLNQKTSAAYLDSLNIAYKEYIDNLSLVHKSWTVLSQDERQAQLNRLLRIRTLSELKKLYIDNIAKIELYRQALTRPGAGRAFEIDVELGLKNINKAVKESKDIFVDFGKALTEPFGQAFAADALKLNILAIQNAFHGQDINGSKQIINDLQLIIDKGDLAKVDVYELQDRIDQFYSATTRDVLMIPILDKMKKGLQLTQEELEKVRAKFGQVNKDAQTAFNTQQIVKFVAGIGQVASGINGLVNITKVWKNESLSAGEKLLQTFTGLSMSIGMLHSGFKSILPVVGTLFSTITVGTSGATVGTIAQTAATKGLSVALALAGVSAGALMAALWPLFVVGGLIAGVVATVAAIDHFTMSAKEAELAIDAFNEKQKLMANNNATFHEQTSTLELLKDLYELLAKKAGAINFDATIDNLTLAERLRYNLIKGIIALYNDKAVAGYNAQGLAILQNNTNLELQIKILLRKKQALIDAYVASLDYQNAKKAYGVRADLTLKNYAAFILKREGKGEGSFSKELSDHVTNLSNRLRDVASYAEDDLESIWKDIAAIQLQGLNNLSTNLKNLESSLENVVWNLGVDISDLIDLYLDNIRNFTNIDLQLANLKAAADLASKIPIDVILTELQASANNTLYKQLALVYGLAMINSLIQNYTEGFTFDDFNNIDLAVQQVRQELLQSLQLLNLTSDDLEKITKKVGKFSENTNLSQIIFEDYKNLLEKLVQDIYGLSSKLKTLASENPDQFKELITTFLGLKDFDFHIENKELIVDTIVDSEVSLYELAQNKIKEKIASESKSGALGGGVAQSILSSGLSFLEDIPLESLGLLDLIILKAAELGYNWLQARAYVEGYHLATAKLETFDLMGQWQAGDIKADSLLYKQLSSQLQKLALQYPGISNAVRILQIDWMQSTMTYQNALHDVNNLLLETMQKSIELGSIDLSLVSNNIKNYVSDSETLQNALGKQLLTTEDYADVLGRLASQYESCSDELNHYAQALAAGDELTVENAQAVLTLSLRSAELAEATGISGNQIERVAAQLALLNPLLLENAELAADAAVRYIKLNTSIDDLYNNAESYRELLANIARDGWDVVNLNEKLFESFLNLKDIVADVFDTSADALSDDWIISHLEEIIQMAEQGGEGLELLRAEAAEQILVNTGIDMSNFYMDLTLFLSKLAELEEGADINCLANLDLLLFSQQLVTALQQAGYAQEDIERIFSGLQLDIDLAPYKAGLNQLIDDSELAGQLAGAALSNSMAETGGVDAKIKTESQETPQSTDILGQDYVPDYVKGEYTTPIFSPVLIAGVSFPLPTGSRTVASYVPVFRAKPNKETVLGTTTTSATALEVVGLNKSSGGKISHVNSPASRAARTPSKPSGGGGGSKGSSPKAPSFKSITNAAKVDTTVKKTTVKAPTPEKLDDTKIKEKLIEETILFLKTEELELLEVEEERADVYHDINILLDKSDRYLKELKDKEDKLIPRDRLKLLEEENKAYEEQNKLYEEKIDIANNEQVRIQKELADLNAGVQFGEDGFVSNYALVYNKLNLQVNDATEEANKKRLKLYNDYNEKIAKKNALLLNANNADQLAQNKLTNAYRTAQKTYNDAVTNYNNRNSSLADAAQRDIEGYEAAAEALKLAANKIFLAAQDRHQGVLRDYNSLTGDQQENYKAILQQEDDLFKNAQTTLSDTLKDIDRNLDKQVEARKKTLLNQQNDLKSVLDQAEQVWSDAEDKYKDDSDKINQRKKDRLKLYKLWEKQLNKEYEKQLKAIEKQLGDLLDRRKNIIDLMKLAEETQNLILKYQLKERANDLAKIDNLIAQSKFRVDMSIDTGDFEREFLDFEKKFIKKIAGDDFLGSAKASMKDLMSYINSEQVSLTADQIKMIQEQIDSILKTGTSSVYGDRLTEAKADLEQYMRQQMSDLQAIQEQVDNIKNSYLSAIDSAKSKMDDQINQYERINGLVDHQVKMAQLLYGDKAYDTLDKYYNLQKRNNQDLLNSLKRQQDYWQEKLNSYYNEDGDIINRLAWEKVKSNLDDVTDKLNSKLLVMIDNLSKQWSNRVDGIIARFNNGMTGGRGLNYLDEQWDQINNYDNQFLDTFESKTGIDEVERLYQSTIDGLAGSPKSQQALNKLMNDQLKLLREKDHLTEYDLERAKASLEVEKARLALEEARDNKTKMRLRRDSQGNYTYQYVADEEKLGDLQAALADAQANLYNTDKEHYKQNLNELYSTYKNYLDQMRSLTEEYNKTQDEEERKRIQGRMDLLKTSTDKLMNGLTLDNKYLLQYLNGSFFDGMGVDTSALTMEEQMEIMQQNIPQMQSGIQDLADTIVGEGGILNATADAMKEINEATSEYDKNVKDMLASAGTSLQTIEQAIDKEGNALDKNIQNAEAFITTNQKLIDECNAQIEAMEKMLDYMDKYLNKVINVLTLVSSLRSAYGTVQGLNGSDLTADKITTEGWGLDTTKGMEYTGNPAIDAAAVKQQIDALMAQYQTFLAQMSIAAFETGGYTGTWGDAEGRLAFLHQGELVLNQLDTSNILSAVQLVRNMASAINGFASGEINSLMSGTTGLLGGISNTEQLDQNVHIEANFPNVTQHTEIEQAFENLVNMASMRASKYRD